MDQYGNASALAKRKANRPIVQRLDKESGFTPDVCASAENAKCARFFTKQDDALTQQWIGVCWCNPPYCGRTNDIERWLQKAYESSLAGATVVCLVPAQTESDWFHDWVLMKAEIRFLRHRRWFDSGLGARQPFGHYPSAVLIYRPAADP